MKIIRVKNEVKSPINYIEHKAFEQLFAEALKNK